MKHRQITEFLPVLLLSLCFTCPASAREPASEDFSALDLEELLNVPVSVASGKTNTTRESPGIVSLITAEEIENSGARDLIDILHMVPGFDFAADVWGTVGPSIRGVYNSGKISFLVDGNEFVERLYSNILFGNHFPIDQIQQIEIIRGPGSVLYGGTAEMAVVNIITKKAKDLNGISASFLNGQMANTYARRNVNFQFGKEFTPDANAYGSFFVSEGNRSDSVYTDAYGTSYELKDFSKIDSLFLNAGAEYKNLRIQWIVDRYALEERDHYNVVIPEPTTNHFNSYFLDTKYEHKITSQLSVIPRFNFSRQIPWHIDNRKLNAQFATFYKAICDRYTASVVGSYKANETVDLLGGVEFYYDDVEFDKDSYNVNTPVNLKQNYSNTAAFLQGSGVWSFGNITAGARFENHNQFGSTFVPRLSFTKAFDRFHLKALYSRAFRAPNIESIRFNSEIEPEKTRAIEFEGGYKLGNNMFLIANIFDVAIDGPILYVYENNRDNYFNFDRTGSRGFETEYRLRDTWGYLTVNYSYYKALDGSVPPYQAIDYQDAGRLVNDDIFLAIPQHKIGAQASVHINRRLTLTSSAVRFSRRFGYQSVDLGGNLILTTYEAGTLVNLYLLIKKAFGEKFDVGVGVYDLFGNDYEFVASYNSGHAPLPGPTREFLVKLSYRY